MFVCSLSMQYKMYNEDSRFENCLVLNKCLTLYNIYPFWFPWVSIFGRWEQFGSNHLHLNIPVPHILIVDLCVDYTFPETDCSARPFFTWRWYRINDWKLQCISLSRSCTLSPHRTNYTMSIFTFLCFSLSEGREEKKTLFEFEMKWNWGIILQRRY